MKRQDIDWEKFFAMFFSDKGFVYRIYFLKSYKSIRKRHTTPFKKWARDSIGHFTK